MTIFIGIFFILHALVHLLYFGQALRFFELRPGLAWPDSSWLFSRLLGDPVTRWLAAGSLALAAFGFLVAGLGLFLGADWWRTLTLYAAGFSVVFYLLFWDARIPPDRRYQQTVQRAAEKSPGWHACGRL